MAPSFLIIMRDGESYHHEQAKDHSQNFGALYGASIRYDQLRS